MVFPSAGEGRVNPLVFIIGTRNFCFSGGACHIVIIDRVHAPCVPDNEKSSLRGGVEFSGGYKQEPIKTLSSINLTKLTIFFLIFWV